MASRWRTWRLLAFALLAVQLALVLRSSNGGGGALAAFDFDLNELPPEEPDELTSVASTSDFVPPPSSELSDHEDDELPSKKRRKTNHDESTETQQQQGFAKGLWGRMRSKLPDYFDFNQFKDKFKRKYRSAESFLRQSIFLQKCLAVLKARVDFRLGRKSYLESVNQFSDRTAQEFRSQFMAAPPIELLNPTAATGSNESVELENQRPLIEGRLRLLEELNSEHYVPELQSQASASGDGGGALLNEQLAKRLVEQLYEQNQQEQQAGEARAFEEALLQELDGFNVETESQSSASELDGARPLPWPGLKQAPKETGEPAELAPYAAPKLERGESLDWSRHECFHELYSQGSNCGKCYVMASTALAEFYKCTERGPDKPIAKRKFSKEYVLECAQKFSPAVMGCAGGSPLQTLRFIALAGIFNIRDWRQRRSTELKEARQSGFELDALDMRCPLSTARTPLAEWGSIRVEMSPVSVSAAEWKEALEDGPLVASVQMPAEGVDTYAGGVHDGRGCASSGAWHAMLLVGYGTNERGQQYWRFRNSFGPDWGDAGHFNLAMDVPSACLPGGVRVYREPLAA